MRTMPSFSVALTSISSKFLLPLNIYLNKVFSFISEFKGKELINSQKGQHNLLKIFLQYPFYLMNYLTKLCHLSFFQYSLLNFFFL